MDFISKLKKIWKELKGIAIYGDTQSLELMQGVLLAFSNSYQLKIIADSCGTKIKFGNPDIQGCQHIFLILAAVCCITGIGILYTALVNKLSWRVKFFRLYWGLCVSIASLIYVCEVYMPAQYYLSYLIQFIFASYTLWKLNKEYIVICIRRASHGKQ